MHCSVSLSKAYPVPQDNVRIHLNEPGVFKQRWLSKQSSASSKHSSISKIKKSHADINKNR